MTQSDIQIDKQGRAELRQKLLINAVFLRGDTTFSVVFDGYGDSGTVHAFFPAITDDQELSDELEKFFDVVVDREVHWDWYNDEGGGGNVVWDLEKDTVTINGYYNVTEQEHQAEQVI